MILHWENHNLHAGRMSRRSLGGACAMDPESDPEGMVLDYKSQKDLNILGALTVLNVPPLWLCQGK